MGFWLLHISDSMTAILCLSIGVIILLSHKLLFLKTRPRFSLFLFLGALPLIVLLKSVPDISDPILQMLGRNPTLTNRTEIWQVVKDHPVDPLIGCGYLMYWDINKSVQLGQADDFVSLKSIHNGYLEIYLDGGYLGLSALFFMLICLGVRAARVYLGGSDYGRLLLAFFVITLFYNLSESVYARRGPLWFSFLLFCIGGSPIFFNRLCQPQSEPDDVLEESVTEDMPNESLEIIQANRSANCATRWNSV
jgi:O-antigen ligase